MAIKNLNNNYLRIICEDVNYKFIDIEIFKTQQSRIDGVSEFEKKESRRIMVPINLNVIPEANNTKSIMNLIRTQSYTALKLTPEFKDWIDC